MNHILETGLDPIIAPPPTRREATAFALAWVDKPERPRIRLDAPDEERPMYLMYRCSIGTDPFRESGWGFTPIEAYQRWVALVAP